MSPNHWNDPPPSPRGRQGGEIIPPIPDLIDLTGDNAISVYEEVIVIGTPRMEGNTAGHIMSEVDNMLGG